LGQLKKSPRHYQESVALEQSKPLVIGSLVHCGRLEPLSLAERYAVMPDYHLDAENTTAKGVPTDSKATSYYKAKRDAFLAANDRKEIVTQGWYDECKQLITSLAEDELANRILTCKEYELTIVWRDQETRLLCKARLDGLADSHLVDLKTTADLETFPRSFFRYGYHRQAAHYQNGWATLTGELLPMWIVAVEKCQPVCVQAAPISDAAMEAGEVERAELLELLVACQQSGEWPGPPSPEFWTIPEWAEQPITLRIGSEELSV
jgi:hypothetical protein